MKKLFCILASIVLSFTILLGGCSLSGADGRDGRDGKDGQDVTIEQIYNKYVEEHGETSFDDFLKEYLNFTDTEIVDAASLKTIINRSLLSGVSILTRFAYTTYSQGAFGQNKSTTYKVYTGSGAILWMDKEQGDAYVVTNCHVIYDGSSTDVFCNDIRLYLYGQDVGGINYLLSSANDITDDENYRIPATIVGASKNYDLALLKVDNSEVLKRSSAVAVSSKTSVTEAIYDSFATGDPVVGDTVFAIGNAEGEGMSAANGIVSKDSEQIDVSLSESNSEPYSFHVLRTTAPINHGNSGGALYNTSGKIVGIVNAKDESTDVENMGYALPANCVKRLLVAFYEGYVSNGNKPVSGTNTQYGIWKVYLNIQTSVADSYAYLNEDNVAVIKELVKVESVDGAPAKGKLQAGDLLLEATLTSSAKTETIEITRNYSLAELLLSAKTNDKLTLIIERDNAQQTVEISLNSVKYFE